jgi:hypothetical protein
MAETTDPESLTRNELIAEIRLLLEWSLETGYYPGKLDHPRFIRLQQLNSENEIRLGAL